MRPYKTSKNYEKLYELINSGYEIACFFKQSGTTHLVSSDGLFYYFDNDIKVSNKDEFLEHCVIFSVEYIPPTKEVVIKENIWSGDFENNA